jgi:hypothetical protein
VGTEKELGKKLIGGFSFFNVNSSKKCPKNRKNSLIFESTKLENKHYSLILKNSQQRIINNINDRF